MLKFNMLKKKHAKEKIFFNKWLKIVLWIKQYVIILPNNLHRFEVNVLRYSLK